MAAYCLENGKIWEAYEEDVSRDDVKIYHISTEGKMAETQELPVLAQGEGLFMHNEGFYVEPLEIQVDFLKSSDAKVWMEKMAIRHIDRVRYVDEALWALAEIREEEG